MHGVRPTSGFDWGSIGPPTEMGQRMGVPCPDWVGHTVGCRVGYRGHNQRMTGPSGCGPGRAFRPGHRRSERTSAAGRSGHAVEAERVTPRRRPSEWGYSRPSTTAASGYSVRDRRASKAPARKWCVVPPGTGRRRDSRSRTRRTHEAADQRTLRLGPSRRSGSPANMAAMDLRCT